MESAAREIVEILGVRKDGSPGERLEDLFVRFQAQVPYQSVGRERAPERLLEDFLETGAGGEGDERTNAFLALTRFQGHEMEDQEATSPWGERRVAVSRIEGRTLLVDPAFPLPCLVPLDRPGEEIPTGYGRISTRTDGATCRLILETRGKMVEAGRFGTVPGTRSARPGRSPWRLSEGERFRLLDDRLLRWRGGRMEVTDSWSRLAYPLGGVEKAILEALFRVPAEDLAATPPDAEPPTLTVYDLSPLPKTCLEARARRDSGNPVEGFPGAGGTSPFRSRSWSFEENEEGTRVKLTARLADVPPRGLTETIRRTLVFHLTAEVLDLSRD